MIMHLYTARRPVYIILPATKSYKGEPGRYISSVEFIRIAKPPPTPPVAGSDTHTRTHTNSFSFLFQKYIGADV